MRDYILDNISAAYLTDADGNPTPIDILDWNGVSLLSGTTFQVPNTFATNQWSVATGSNPAEINITISVLPANNGSAITAIQYRVGTGAWVALPQATTGTYPVTMPATSTPYSISLRAINVVGPSAQSAAKTATSGAPAATAPAAFGPAQWQLTTGTAPSSLNLNILTLPNNGGSPITAIEYKVGSGEWVGLDGVETGPRSITMEQGSTAYSVTIRAVNAVNPGPAAAAKTATSAAPVALLTMTATIAPNPPAAGQPFTVVFDPAPDTAPGLTGTGATRTGTAPASGDLTISATKAGYAPFSMTVATVPAVAPAASGGEIQWDGDTVTLVPPAVTAGYPEPTRTLQSLTVAGVNRIADLDGEDLHGVQAAASSQVISATWLFSNGVSPNKTVTLTYTIPAAAITATVEPTPARLYAGQTPAAIPGIATATNAANYASTGGAIVSAQLQVNGENATTSTALAVGDQVSVLVTDDDGLTRRWVLSTVEFALRISPESGGSYRSVEINDLIPGAQSIDWTWEGVTITTTRNALEAGPVNHILPTMALDGDTFSLVSAGRWINELDAGVPTYAYQWRRNGTAISGATGSSYTRGSSDAGTTTTLAVTATDTNGASAPAVTTGIANPAAPSTGVNFVSKYADDTSSASRTFAGCDFGAAHANRDLLILASSGNTAGATVTGVTVGGVAATLERGQLSTGSGLGYVSLWRARVPTGATGNVVVTYSVATASGQIAILRGVDVVISASVAKGANTTPSTSLAISGATPGHKLFGFVAAMDGTPAWTGLSQIYAQKAGSISNSWASLAEGIVDGTGGATITVGRESGNNGQIALLLFAAG